MARAQNNLLSRSRLTLVGWTVMLSGLALSHTAAHAADCKFSGEPRDGVEPRLSIDASCTDPDYNARTFVIDSTTSKTQKISDTEEIGYTEVKGHFPATRTREQLPPGIVGSPTLVRHGVTWRFPDRGHFEGRFFQGVYPIGGGFVDPTFAFTHGGYIVSVAPGSPDVGYRVDAAAAKLAKDYASKLYAAPGRIYGYIFGVSGGSVQTMGAAEATSGVWDGAMPISIATHSLNVHSFAWNGHYALAVGEAKRKAIAAAAAPESRADLHDGLTADERSALDELLNAGFSLRAMENNPFDIGMTTILAGQLPIMDPTYEDDFWSVPGYEGANPPGYLAAAKVDGFATITKIRRNALGEPVGIELDPGTIPALGSIGSVGLQFYVYDQTGRNRALGKTGGSLVGKLEGNLFTIEKPVQTGFIPVGPPTDPALIEALTVGGKIRINNRFLLAVCFYPRHTALANGNPGYNQYRAADGSWKYPQRPVSIAFRATASTAGGEVEKGAVRFKTIIIENTLDPNSYPYVGAFYHSQIRKSLGAVKADAMARIYYNDNADHSSFGAIRGDDARMLVGFGGLVNRALLDLAAWVERDIPPPPSTRFSIDAMNQVHLAARPSERQGIQPVVSLRAQGHRRAEVAVGQAVKLEGTIAMPPGRGMIMQYDWYLGDTKPVVFETPIKLVRPRPMVKVSRTVRFEKPGTYLVTLRTKAQRNGIEDSTTTLQNLDRVRIVVGGGGRPTSAGTSDGASASDALSIEATPIGTLIAEPAAKASLVKHVPDLMGNASFSAWSGLTLRAVQKLVGASLSDAQLEAIQTDLAKIGKR